MEIKRVKGAQNQICNSMSRARVGELEEIEAVLNNFRGQSNYAYNRIISLVQEDISEEVLEDPALNEIWEAAKTDKG